EQFAYYREKEDDEKRVRALYHDMKNHLLILERQNSAETKQMVSDLRRQISDYEDYIHTGNEFLDVIIHDKAKKAKEQQIDFSAVIHFEDGRFIEPMDLSTIFGNALDNALEASVKMPPEQRLIMVKAGRIHDVLMIVFENHAVIGKMNGTSKEDELLHGFGIPNIRKAVEKYHGECVIRQENGKFVMKNIIPLPEV
ncbi:MAG: sensor histidine kinase, partial [Dorea sp.]|nr:sensor histidine kinase [Dorea sp.]